MNINAGELNKRIHIIEVVRTPDEFGFYEETERIVRTCWAKFSRISGTEVFKANADYSEVKVRFLIRTGSRAIDRKMFVRYNDEDYDILYVNDYDDAGEYTELMCSRKTTEVS